jgi:YVTN family beta-propeller protein
MKKINKTWLLLSAFTLSIALNSCTKHKDVEPTFIPGSYKSGVFITNEGPYGSGSGTITHFDDITNITTNNIFERENDFSLGNIVQSMYIYNGKAYIVVNNANKIEIAKDTTFKSIATITGLNQPRYFLPINNTKAYVTEWGADGKTGAVRVLDLSNNTITSTISTGKGAEKMLKHGDYVYVTCKGGLGNDEVVTVINSTNNTVTTTITVGANPSSIVEDVNGKIWVLCAGKYKSDYSALENPGSLVKIDPSTNTVEQKLDFSSIYSQPSGLTINTAQNNLFYNYDGNVYTHDVSATGLSTSGLIPRSFYGMEIDPSTDIIYASDAGNYSSAGKVIRFQTNGTAIDSMNVGIVPGGFFFK